MPAYVIDSERVEVLLALLPLPSELSADDALRWMREEFPKFHWVASFVSTNGRDAETRSAGWDLAQDLAELAVGCAVAIAQGLPLVFSRESQRENGLEDPIATLTLLVATRSREMIDSTGPFEDAYSALSAELVRLVSERHERIRLDADCRARDAAGERVGHQAAHRFRMEWVADRARLEAEGDHPRPACFDGFDEEEALRVQRRKLKKRAAKARARAREVRA